MHIDPTNLSTIHLWHYRFNEYKIVWQFHEISRTMSYCLAYKRHLFMLHQKFSASYAHIFLTTTAQFWNMYWSNKINF